MNEWMNKWINVNIHHYKLFLVRAVLIGFDSIELATAELGITTGRGRKKGCLNIQNIYMERFFFFSEVFNWTSFLWNGGGIMFHPPPVTPPAMIAYLDVCISLINSRWQDGARLLWRGAWAGGGWGVYDRIIFYQKKLKKKTLELNPRA